MNQRSVRISTSAFENRPGKGAPVPLVYFTVVSFSLAPWLKWKGSVFAAYVSRSDAQKELLGELIDMSPIVERVMISTWAKIILESGGDKAESTLS